MKIDVEEIKKFDIKDDEYLIIRFNPMLVSRNDLASFSRSFFKGFPKLIGRVMLILAEDMEIAKIKIGEVKNEETY